MTSTTKTERRVASPTAYEVTGEVGSANGGGAPAVTTEYESPNGLLLTNPQPDAESSNAEAVPARAGEAGQSELGAAGGPGAGLAGPAAAVDAIVGSYPELAAAPEVIIGTDDRIRIASTRVYPWRAICALSITAANGSQFIGTGWLISPRTVVTAGHCVFMHDAGGWVRSIKVIAGCNDADEPYGTQVGSDFRSVTGWTASKNREYDYGAIILPASSRPGDQAGYFGIATRSDAFLMDSALNLSGYPGDKGGRQQWFMAQRPKAVTDRVITYDIDTMGGQSGSPVWILQDGQRYGVGVHTNGSGSGNSATRIGSAVFSNLLSWKNLGM